MTCRIATETIAGWRAIILENDVLRVVVLPERGAELYRLIYRPSGVDILYQSHWGLQPPGAPPRAGSGDIEFQWNYGGGLQYLCNNTQYAGLQDKVPDFRLCTRSFLTNPLLQFLYWHLNYHIEHHMYAAVPCYNLAKLHAAIKLDLPPCPDGLLTAWKEILPILERQKIDPHYQYIAELPAPQAR